jgi:hypothetical protein
MPRAPSQSSARPPLPQSGAEPAHVGGGSAPACSPPPEALTVTFAPITFTNGGATYCTESISLVAKRVSAAQPGPVGEPSDLDKAGRLPIKVFQLLHALDPGNRLRKAPPIKVFLLRFRQNLSLSQIARICNCGKSLVALRLKAIREKLPWQPKQLGEMSAQVEAIQDALTDPRARSIYRKGSVYGDEDDGPESD